MVFGWARFLQLRLTAMAAWLEEKASSFPSFRFHSSWLTKGDLDNRKTAFHQLSTFSAASVRALVRPRASSHRFFALTALSAFALWSNLAREFFLASCNVGTQSTSCLYHQGAGFPETKCLLYTRSLLNTSFDFVSPRLIAFIYFFSPFYSQFTLKFSLIVRYH